MNTNSLTSLLASEIASANTQRRESQQAVNTVIGVLPRVANQQSRSLLLDNISVTSLLQRLCNAHPFDLGLFSKILFHCKLHTILALRLTSKGFYHLASCLSIVAPRNYVCSPLSDKAVINFTYLQVHPNNHPSIQDKIDFAAQRSELPINIIISVNDLPNPSEIFNAIFSHRIRIILKIDNINELNQFQNLVPVCQNVIFIKELDLRNIPIDIHTINSINALLSILAQNQPSISHLTNLTIGEISATICNATTFSFPSFLNSLTIKNINFANLNELKQFQIVSSNPLNSDFVCIIKGLDLAKIDMNDESISLFMQLCKNSLLHLACDSLILGRIANTFTLPDSFEELITLNVGPVNYKCVLKLPDFLPRLKNFSVQWIGNEANVELPAILPNLDTFTCSISSDCTIKLSAELPALTTLTISEIQKNATLQLPVELTSLKTLTIGNIGCHSSIQTAISLDNLTTLTIGNIEASATVNLKNPLNNLTNLTIGNILGGILHLPTLLNSLITFNIGNIDQDAKVQLPNSMNNLTTLTMGSIYGNRDTTITLPNALNSLQTFTIGNIGCKNRNNSISVITLPNLMNNLTAFIIGDILGPNLQLPVLNSLITLIIGNIFGNSNRVELPIALHNIQTLTIGNLTGSIFKLPDFTNANVNFKIGTRVSATIHCPKTNNLQRFL